MARKIGRSEDAEYLIDRKFSVKPLSSADIRELCHNALEEERRGDRPRNDLHFYLHIPFCRQRCSFCYYHLAPVEDGSKLKAYLDATLQSLDFHRPAFAKRNFQTLYVGGGTPTILNPEQIDRFLGAVFERFSFDPNGEKSFE